MHLSVHRSIIYNSKDMETMCPSKKIWYVYMYIYTQWNIFQL